MNDNQMCILSVLVEADKPMKAREIAAELGVSVMSVSSNLGFLRAGRHVVKRRVRSERFVHVRGGRVFQQYDVFWSAAKSFHKGGVIGLSSRSTVGEMPDFVMRPHDVHLSWRYNVSTLREPRTDDMRTMIEDVGRVEPMPWDRPPIRYPQHLLRPNI